MRDMRKVKNRVQFTLDNRQIALIFCGLLTVCVVLFALGVMVGRGINSVGLKPSAVAAPIPAAGADPAVALANLSSEAARNGAVTGEQPLPFTSSDINDNRSPASAPAATPENDDDNISAVVSSLRSGVAAPAPEAAAPAKKAAEPAAAPPVTPAAAPVAKKAAPAQQTMSESSALAEARAQIAAKAAAPASSSSNGKYTIQVGSFQDVGEATSMATRLQSKGYDCYVVTAEIPGMGTWHRVRIGHFRSRKDAKGYAGELKSKEGIDPFVAINPRP
jgi:DedD protein